MIVYRLSTAGPPSSVDPPRRRFALHCRLLRTLLAAAGADILICPRSSERATYDKWRPVWISNALTTACYVCSVNRPNPEQGVLIGGPSIAIKPNGEIITESENTITSFTAAKNTIEEVRIQYPGYLPCRKELYTKCWNALEGTKNA